jgi:enterochelin esterase-like enzyme
MKVTIILIAFIHLTIFPQMNTGNNNKLFIKFFEEVQNASGNERQQLAEGFIKSITNGNYPVFENDSTVVLIFKGNKDSVNLIGDMTNWSSSVPLKKIEGTDLFYFRGNYEPEARLDYLFELNMTEFPMIDQFNEYKSVNALFEMSELAMPGYIRHPVFKDYERGKKGDLSRVKELKTRSEYLGYDHIVHVYLPPGYDENVEYPAVYFQDGLDYIEYAIVPHTLDELIISGHIKPLIAVFVTPPNLHQPAMPNRMTEYGMNDKYAEYFVKELVPFIDSLYPTRQNAADRLVIGDSYGGLISVYISFCYPEVIQKAYSQSGYLSFSKDKLIKIFDSSDVKPVELYVDVGTYEETVGASFIPADETNFTEGNRRFRKMLGEKGYNFVYKEYYEGHTWGNWRRHLIDALIHFFSFK